MFSDYPYRRIDMEGFKKRFHQALNDFQKAITCEEQNDAIGKINELREEFGAMKAIAFIRHSQDVKDDYYSQEHEFMTNAATEVQELISKYYRLLLDANNKDRLKEHWGEQLFQIAKQSIKTYSKEVAEDLQKEGRLANEYMAIIAKAKVLFDGQERNMMELYPYMESQERRIRKEAHEAFAQILQNNEEELDELYDSLVKIRDRIAKQLGFKNFLGLGYARLMRTDYNPQMVARFREQVHKHITPLIVELRERQRDRLGLESLKYYDEDIKFLSGNAVPKGGAEFIIENSRKMYNEMSEETRDFFTYMEEKGLMDLLDGENKAKMGYCASIPQYRDVFVFSTFNGTSYDVSVMTHELGHAFQGHCSRELAVLEYMNATAEVSELHALAMEFFAWPWLGLFFQGDEDRFKYSTLFDAINLNLSIGVIGDEFQEWVYQNPEATPAQRKKVWRDIEKKYWPYKDYDGHEFYENGGLWLRFLHFFQAPLYLIDYALAEVCAFQFFKKTKEGNRDVWKDYVALCKAGGSASFLKLLEIANLRSPFEDSCVASVIDPIAQWFREVDDSLL